MTYSHLHPQDNPLIKPVPPVVLVDLPPRVRHPNHILEFDYSIDIESLSLQDEFGDSEGDPILDDILHHAHDPSSPGIDTQNRCVPTEPKWASSIENEIISIEYIRKYRG
jgi:hypothetical protein